jgi:Zn-dependent M32 family carboxypeptidase
MSEPTLTGGLFHKGDDMEDEDQYAAYLEVSRKIKKLKEERATLLRMLMEERHKNQHLKEMLCNAYTSCNERGQEVYKIEQKLKKLREYMHWVLKFVNRWSSAYGYSVDSGTLNEIKDIQKSARRWVDEEVL